MDLYVFDNYKGNRTQENPTDRLIGLALKQYAKEHSPGFVPDYDRMKICRTQKGKPYVLDPSLHFSVSHSDNQWVCLIGSSENGVDIQKNHHSNFQAIANRFYMPDERDAVRAGGLEAFIRIWCRKEAFIKYFGLTMGETMEWLNVARDGYPLDKIDYHGRTIYFSDIQVNQDYQCVAATGKKEEIWIKKLQTG